METGAAPRNLIADLAGFGAGDLVLSEVFLQDDQGRCATAFDCGEDLTLTIRARAARAVLKPNLGFSLVRGDGELVFAISTLNLGLTLPDLGAGEDTAARIRVTLALAPDSYFLTVAAGDTDRSPSGDSGVFHDTRERLGPVVVRPNAASARFDGIIDLPLAVRLHRVARDSAEAVAD